MRKSTIIVVAVMILLAGCSGGGGGAASPTEESETDTTASGTPMEETATGDSMEPATETQAPETSTPGTPTPESDDGGDDSSQFTDSVLDSTLSDEPLMGSTVVDGATYNGSQQASAVIRNDTANNRELIEFTDESGTTSEVYTTADYIAVRNGTTGEVTYGGSDSLVGSSVSFRASSTAYGAAFFIGIVEWEQTGTTTIDGEEATVFESDRFNQTVYEQSRLQFGFESQDVQSTDGRIVVTSDGRFKSVTVQIETENGTYGGDMSVRYDDITLDKPSWVDESQSS